MDRRGRRVETRVRQIDPQKRIEFQYENVFGIVVSVLLRRAGDDRNRLSKLARGFFGERSSVVGVLFGTEAGGYGGVGFDETQIEKIEDRTIGIRFFETKKLR